ncbi:ABC transporter ATP-binding protein [Paenibacillus macquariensis]|nr:ABC transporter ATP-binding protein [Paenibacillus macquariensis]MEC0093192.1 ABC transporter ATP-binding protein [Paenibacillus macquariensis]OAB35080.1 bacitracin ABC transporter ATP-binding protein [Paenibacillus macquariensis subsp. macquariensis]
METLQLNQVSKIYNGKVSYKALSDITFKIQQGEFVGIMGPSGSGKTTLLNLISTIDEPTSGEILINNKRTTGLSKKELATFRRREFGLVFQDFNLLDTLTVKENIILPLSLDRKSVVEMNIRVQEIAERIGIADILDKRTYEISGGQRQRAAIARAVIHKPSLLLADEPTGNLDSNSARNVMRMMETLNREDHTTTLLVTHDPVAASYCQRIIFIKDGQLHNELRRGENKQTFYQEIINTLSFLGGESRDI